MVSAENRTGLYVTIPIYFCLLAGATAWAYRRMEQMVHNKTADKLSAHYIGGRDFGPLIITGTLFASMYSGYTVVGIPNEAFRTGWQSIRWMPTFAGVIWGLIGTGFRLRKVSQFRNHQSPADFITDRFQSQLLRYTIVFLQVLTSVIYLAAQVIAIKSTFNSIFGLDPDTIYPVIIIMLLILVFECIGGLNSVAFTDSIQGLIMVFAFISIPSLLAQHYGGWSSLDPETYPQPSFYQTPTAASQWKFWQFGLINFSFFTLPHFLQRIYAVRDLQSLRIGYTVLTFAPWVAGFVGIFIGTIGVSILVNEDGSPMTPADPFTEILEALMDIGGFANFCACLGITAGLAAIMSTADSLIIAISQLLCVEVFYPVIPTATPAKMAWYGRLSSLVAVVLALIVGLYWDEGITDLGRIQFPLTMQVVPPFLVGLFAKSKAIDVHPWSLVASVVGSSMYVVGIYFGYLRRTTRNPAAIDAGITGIVIQLALVILLESTYRLLEGKTSVDSSEINKNDERELLYPNRPRWDIPKMERFGAATLSPELIWKSMDGFYEPMVNIYWNILMFVSITVTTPMVAPSEPAMLDETTFLSLPYTIDGLPWWAFKSFILSILPFLWLLIAIYKIPSSFPMEDEATIVKKGVNVSLVHLTSEEMGRRTSYDEPNILIRNRRSSISSTMDEMGISPDEPAPKEIAVSESHKRLSNLVYARNSEKLEDIAECKGDNDKDSNSIDKPTKDEEIDC